MPRYIMRLSATIAALSLITAVPAAAQQQDDTTADAEAESSAAEVERETTDTGAASQEATDAAVDAARSGEPVVDTAEDEAQAAAEEEGVVGAEADDAPAELFTVEGYDPERTIAVLEQSQIGDVQKESLIRAIREAEGSPMSLEIVLEQAARAAEIDLEDG